MAALLSLSLATAVMMAFHRYATASLVEEITAAGGRVAAQVEHQKAAAPLAGHKDRKLQIVDPRGVVVASTPQLKGRPVMAGFTPDSRNIDIATVCGGVFPSGECDIVVAQSAHRAGQDWIVYSASPEVPALVDPGLATTVGGIAALLAVAVTILGNRIVSASLRPVTAIQTELDKINETCPGRRVPLPRSQDEIYELADSVNHTLGRLQAAMTQQRNFTKDASHELRSPIAAIRAEVEDALHAPEETTVTKVGNTVLGSLDRLEAIVRDLLTIAGMDGGKQVGHEPIDLAELLTAAVGSRPHAKKTYEYSLEPGVTVIGDRAWLSRLLTNLIDNAERHAATTVLFHVHHTPSHKRNARRFPKGVAVLEVIDNGPGIDPDKRELVFQRFARLDTARDRSAGGTGLGLAIARQIAEAHNGTLRIEDCSHGARFVLRLPCARVRTYGNVP
ncbi:HAMP domain-containing histidine kinase [Nonomuraea sp. K274]|uniref:histidine kinase n=1 Tax=Nonomuraea cypriaca TaxID=1187855 RepID=A0A931AJ85_9ACTN|nr:HAMP domain-containing sensor histidine kinase [Nonomuraea cypriaca]MBF8191170.1 HAMP domain-containing histidine kinase [Nonomuraea cypriaca]